MPCDVIIQPPTIMPQVILCGCSHRGDRWVVPCVMTFPELPRIKQSECMNAWGLNEYLRLIFHHICIGMIRWEFRPKITVTTISETTSSHYILTTDRLVSFLSISQAALSYYVKYYKSFCIMLLLKND